MNKSIARLFIILLGTLFLTVCSQPGSEEGKSSSVEPTNITIYSGEIPISSGTSMLPVDKITAKAAPAATVTFFNNGKEIGQAVADSNGNVTLKLSTPLGSGVYNITAVSREKDKEASKPTEKMQVTVEVNTSTMPTELAIYGESGNKLSPPNVNEIIAKISAKAKAGARVKFFNSENEMGEAITQPDGQAEITLSPPLSNGKHKLSAIAIEDGKGPSEKTQALSLTVQAEQTTQPTEIKIYNSDKELSGKTVYQPIEKISAKSEASATTTFLNNNIEIGQTQADSSGLAILTLQAPLGKGTYSIQARAKATGKNSSELSTVLSVQVEPLRSTTPTSMKLYAEGTLITPPSSSKVITKITVQVTGNATVTFLNNSQVLATITAPESGLAEYIPAIPLGNKTYALTAVSSEEDKSPSLPSEAISVTVNAPDSSTPTELKAYNSAGLISSQNSNKTITQLSAKAVNANGKINFYNNGNLIDIQAVDQTTSIATHNLETPLGNGQHIITARASETGNNESSDSTSLQITVDASISNIPTGIKLYNGTTEISPPSSKLTIDKITAHASNGAMVEFFNSEDSLGTAQATSGTAELTLSPALGPGDYSISAIATETDKSPSPKSSTITITINQPQETAPTNLKIYSNTDELTGANSDKFITRITANALAAATVTFFNTDESSTTSQLGQAVASEAGLAELTFSPSLKTGVYSFSAKAISTGKLESLVSTSLNFTVTTPITAAPTGLTAYDSSSVTLTSPTEENIHKLSVSAPANSEVVFYNGQSNLGSVTASQAGRAEITLTTPIGVGSHSFTATAKLADHSVSTPSTALKIDVVLPLSTKPTNMTFYLEGTLVTVTNTNTSKVDELRINATAGAQVTFYQENGETDINLGETTANIAGSANLKLSIPLKGRATVYQLYTTALEDSHRVSEPSDIFVLTIKQIQNGAPSDLKIFGSNGEITTATTTTIITRITANVTGGNGKVVKFYNNTTLIASDSSTNGKVNAAVSLGTGSYSFTAVNTGVPDDGSLPSQPTTALAVEVTADDVVPTIDRMHGIAPNNTGYAMQVSENISWGDYHKIAAEIQISGMDTPVPIMDIFIKESSPKYLYLLFDISNKFQTARTYVTKTQVGALADVQNNLSAYTVESAISPRTDTTRPQYYYYEIGRIDPQNSHIMELRFKETIKPDSYIDNYIHMTLGNHTARLRNTAITTADSYNVEISDNILRVHRRDSNGDPLAITEGVYNTVISGTAIEDQGGRAIIQKTLNLPVYSLPVLTDSPIAKTAAGQKLEVSFSEDIIAHRIQHASVERSTDSGVSFSKYNSVSNVYVSGNKIIFELDGETGTGQYRVRVGMQAIKGLDDNLNLWEPLYTPTVTYP